MLRHHAPPIVAGAALAVVLAACSSSARSGSTTTTFSSARGDQIFVDYVHCVRARGVQISDPIHRPGHVGLSLSLPDAGTPGFAAADAACHHILAPVIAMKAAGRTRPTPATTNALVAYARCMRQHDIPLLDPDPNDGHLALGSVPGINNDVGRQDAAFHQADARCRHLLPATIPDDGTGPP
jgi:hypothetical protein